MTTCALLTLALAVEPTVLPSSKMVDLSFNLRFSNACSEEVQVFPATAQMEIVSGWASTQWHLQITTPKDTYLQELRSWYGPPAEPPEEKYYQDKMILIASGKHFDTTIRACWIPHRLLMPENLAIRGNSPKVIYS